MLGLARSISMEEMATQVAALRLRIRSAGTMSRLRDYPEKLKLGGRKTMAGRSRMCLKGYRALRASTV